MTPPITRRSFLKALVIAPAVPLLPPVFIEPRWRGEMAVEFTLDENSYLFTGPGVWSEGAEVQIEDGEEIEPAEGEGPYDYPGEVYAKLSRAERKILQLEQDKWGAVRYVGEWENEDLNAFGEKLNELGIPLYLTNEWRWMGDWFSS